MNVKIIGAGSIGNHLAHSCVSEGLNVTMHLDECLESCEIVVLALPSSVILDVVNEMIPSLKQRHVLLDLAKGLAPGDSLISDSIKQMLRNSELYNSLYEKFPKPE